MKNVHQTPQRFETGVDSSPENKRLCDRKMGYQPPRLLEHGALGALIRGASWKGVDSTGEIDPENAFPV